MRRKQMRIVSLGLAAALLFSMPARADVQIIPLEAFNNQAENRAEPGQSKGSEGQAGTAQQSGSVQQTGPGRQTGSGLMPTAAYTTTDKETESMMSREIGWSLKRTQTRSCIRPVSQSF